MAGTAPVAVVIPTYSRGIAVLSVLATIERCDPRPQEIWVHVDASDGSLKARLTAEFPGVHVLESSERVGPGGGRHRCLLACTTPYAASFDDDSYPVDPDYFGEIVRQFENGPPDVAVLQASIWSRGEPPLARDDIAVPAVGFVGCGHAIRLAAYRRVRGYLPKPVPYAIEEPDVGIQLLSSGWRIVGTSSLRVFHDTDGLHRESPEITAGTISNVALFAFLHYPASGLGLAVLRLANAVYDAMRRGRHRGILPGIAAIPGDCYRVRQYRKPVPLSLILELRNRRRLGS